jgi:hypothetical protein
MSEAWNYRPYAVWVTDPRETVSGAAIWRDNYVPTYVVIPPEGDAPECWMGDAHWNPPPGVDERSWMEACAEAAKEGAAGRSGTVEVATEEGGDDDESGS